MKYIKVKEINSYIGNRKYCSTSVTGSLIGMKKLYGWDQASEIVRSGSYYYCIW